MLFRSALSTTAPTPTFIATGSVTASVNVGTGNVFTLISGSTPTTLLTVSSSGNVGIGISQDNRHTISGSISVITGNSSNNSNTIYALGYVPFKAEYVNSGNTLVEIGGQKGSSLFVSPSVIGTSNRVAQFQSSTNSSVYINAVGLGVTVQDRGALLELSSSEAGFLTSRMTSTQRLAIPITASGVLVYETGSSSQTEGLWVRKTDGWNKILTNTGSLEVTGSIIFPAITTPSTALTNVLMISSSGQLFYT